MPLGLAQTPAAAKPVKPGPAAPATPGAGAASGSTLANSPLNANVDEISLDLTVRTKHNKRVNDLQPSQLSITDDGSPIQLSSLRLVEDASESQHLVTFVFDRLTQAGAKSARSTAQRILGIIPENGYSIAVLQVNGRLHLLQSYTRDRHLVDAALANATPPTPAAASADLTSAEKGLLTSADGDSLTLDAASRAQGKMLLSALEQSQRILEDRRSSPSLAALQALVLSDRLLTGRKFLVYFSGGMAANSDAREPLKSIVAMANRAGVTLCVVNSNSLDAGISSNLQNQAANSMLGKGAAPGNVSAFGQGNIGNGGSSGSFSPGAALNSVGAHNAAGFEFGDVDASESPLVPLALGTGGLYIRASGATRHQLDQLHEDFTSWYQLSWSPPIKDYDGQFRPIAIHALRKGLVIRARSGYFAVPPTDSLGIRPFEMPLLNILAAPALPNAVAFRSEILHLGQLPDGDAGELVVQAPVAQLEAHEDANTHISSVDAAIVAVIKDSKGAVLERFGGDFPLHEASDMLHAASGQSITLQRHFSAPPGTYTLEAVVLDRLSNKAGAERTTFTIGPPAQGPALSDIALVDSVEPDEQDSGAFEPMRYGDGLVVPNLAGSIPGDSRSLSLFFLVHPVAGSQNQPALRMQIFRNHELLAEMPMELQKVSGSGNAIPYLGSIHGHAFAAGEYEVRALLTQDGGTVESSASFTVEGAGTNSAAPSPGSAPGSPLTAEGSSNPDEADTKVVSEAAAASSSFVITSPHNSLPPPSDAEIQAMIEGARQRALAWNDSLVNFFCLEVTNHSVDATGHGDWKHKDTLIELMRYVDHGESRSTLSLNGDRSNAQPDQLQFIHSAGEFGAIFHVLFNPSSKTVFTWKQSAFFDGQPVQVFAFKVARANSGFDLTDRDNHTLAAGFHGLLYLDPATRSVRRVEIDVDDIPHGLLIRASGLSVDYSWISMQDHDFLLPIHGTVSLQQSRGRPVLNEFEFRNYHRFGSQTHILTDEELKALSAN